jgi:hypothetical protein
MQIRDPRVHIANGFLRSRFYENSFGRNLRIKPNLVKLLFVNTTLNGFKLP